MERPCRTHPGTRWSALAGLIQGPDGAPLQDPSRPRWSALAGPIHGPGETPTVLEREADELSLPNQGPSHRAHGGKYIAQGTLATISTQLVTSTSSEAKSTEVIR